MGDATRKSTSNYVLRDDTLLHLQNQILYEYSGIPKKKIKHMKIKVGQCDGEDLHMWTTIYDYHSMDLLGGNKPVLLFAHGYHASGALYFCIYKRLMERFSILTIDHIGFGASSRPLSNYDPHRITPQENIDYYVNYLEQWRIQFSKEIKTDFSGFYLMGHSFGGYISGNYTSRFPQHVKKLLLVSPVGLRVSGAAQLDEQDGDEVLEPLDENETNPCVEDMKFHIRLMFKLIWSKKISPFEVSRICGKGWMLNILDEYMDHHIPDDEDLKAIVKAYTYQI